MATYINYRQVLISSSTIFKQICIKMPNLKIVGKN